MEELVAEIGAAFLCADLGITPETRDDHAAYIASWLKVLKDDKKAIFTAASHAQKALNTFTACRRRLWQQPERQRRRRLGLHKAGASFARKRQNRAYRAARF
jgi:antirestriction protein ArdC